ncbi:exonuclease domain-containing protein [Alteromonas macleodii]|jgi:DNA polymerase-3 subunit epsilon|nr:MULTISPECIES: 3'-5' exonuclease [Alteromonas]MBL3812089.1 3'-5' exonuclease [Alteromonas macleodii]MBL3885566.1 3'-5' exonuclease [Alteromonas macleodii]CAI2391447.1 DNA polymerase-3 subunit epsilon [Alteromonas macleodii]CAI3966653.1 DNA polymerase-3 subunit epsilon [Alteromonas macleodii]CAI3967047.1 DNA polymerase-3 subunit epsilon [Alteromonas macleodii]
MITRIIEACASVLFGNRQFRKSLRDKMLGDTPLASVDLELTSLDPVTTQITSIGYVSGSAGKITLSSSGYHVINTSADLGQSPVIHGLTLDILQQGEGLADAINSLLPLLKTHVLIFHNARLDLMALDSAFKRCGLPQMEVLYLDTLQLALYQLNKQHQVLPSNSATLTVCRQRLDLPAFPEHNALDDALATMQLFYAQLNELGITLENSLESLAHTNAVGRFKLGVPH